MPIFNIIFNRAQKVLAYTFGFELRPLRAAGTENEQITATQAKARKRLRDDDDDDDDQPAQSRGEFSDDVNIITSYSCLYVYVTGVAKSAWIVVSILPPRLLARMTRPNPNLHEVFASASVPSSRSEHDPIHDEAGVLLDWKRSSSELGSMGLTFLLLALILLNQRALSDGE